MAIWGAIRKPTAGSEYHRCEKRSPQRLLFFTLRPEPLLDSCPDQHRATLCTTGCILNWSFVAAGVVLDALDRGRWNRVDVEQCFAGIRREHPDVVDVYLRVAAALRPLPSVHRIPTTSAE